MNSTRNTNVTNIASVTMPGLCSTRFMGRRRKSLKTRQRAIALRQVASPRKSVLRNDDQILAERAGGMGKCLCSRRFDAFKAPARSTLLVRSQREQVVFVELVQRVTEHAHTTNGSFIAAGCV